MHNMKALTIIIGLSVAGLPLITAIPLLGSEITGLRKINHQITIYGELCFSGIRDPQLQKNAYDYFLDLCDESVMNPKSGFSVPLGPVPNQMTQERQKAQKARYDHLCRVGLEDTQLKDHAYWRYLAICDINHQGPDTMYPGDQMEEKPVSKVPLFHLQNTTLPPLPQLLNNTTLEEQGNYSVSDHPQVAPLSPLLNTTVGNGNATHHWRPHYNGTIPHFTLLNNTVHSHLNDSEPFLLQNDTKLEFSVSDSNSDTNDSGSFFYTKNITEVESAITEPPIEDSAPLFKLQNDTQVEVTIVDKPNSDSSSPFVHIDKNNYTLAGAPKTSPLQNNIPASLPSGSLRVEGPTSEEEITKWLADLLRHRMSLGKFHTLVLADLRLDGDDKSNDDIISERGPLILNWPRWNHINDGKSLSTREISLARDTASPLPEPNTSSNAPKPLDPLLFFDPSQLLPYFMPFLESCVWDYDPGCSKIRPLLEAIYKKNLHETTQNISSGSGSDTETEEHQPFNDSLSARHIPTAITSDTVTKEPQPAEFAHMVDQPLFGPLSSTKNLSARCGKPLPADKDLFNYVAVQAVNLFMCKIIHLWHRAIDNIPTEPFPSARLESRNSLKPRPVGPHFGPRPALGHGPVVVTPFHDINNVESLQEINSKLERTGYFDRKLMGSHLPSRPGLNHGPVVMTPLHNAPDQDLHAQTVESTLEKRSDYKPRPHPNHHVGYWVDLTGQNNGRRPIPEPSAFEPPIHFRDNSKVMRRNDPYTITYWDEDLNGNIIPGSEHDVHSSVDYYTMDPVTGAFHQSYKRAQFDSKKNNPEDVNHNSNHAGTSTMVPNSLDPAVHPQQLSDFPVSKEILEMENQGLRKIAQLLQTGEARQDGPVPGEHRVPFFPLQRGNYTNQLSGHHNKTTLAENIVGTHNGTTLNGTARVIIGHGEPNHGLYRNQTTHGKPGLTVNLESRDHIIVSSHLEERAPPADTKHFVSHEERGVQSQNDNGNGQAKTSDECVDGYLHRRPVDGSIVADAPCDMQGTEVSRVIT